MKVKETFFRKGDHWPTKISEKYSENIEEVLTEISALEFDEAVVELSNSESLIIKLSFPDDVILIINLALESLDSDNPYAVFVVLENRETVVQNYNSVDNIVEGMQSYLADAIVGRSGYKKLEVK